VKLNDKIIIELSNKEAIALQCYLLNSVHNYGGGHIHNHVAFLAYYNNTYALEAMKIRHKIIKLLQYVKNPGTDSDPA
jgi:hypothetical protein